MRAGGDTHSTANPPQLNAWECSPADVAWLRLAWVHLAPGNPVPVANVLLPQPSVYPYDTSLTALNRLICLGSASVNGSCCICSGRLLALIDCSHLQAEARQLCPVIQTSILSAISRASS